MTAVAILIALNATEVEWAIGALLAAETGGLILV